MNCFTVVLVPCAYTSAMAGKNQPPSFDDQGDLTIDYALIATGVGAALVAFAYLLLT